LPAMMPAAASTISVQLPLGPLSCQPERRLRWPTGMHLRRDIADPALVTQQAGPDSESDAASRLASGRKRPPAGRFRPPDPPARAGRLRLRRGL
jgi:hypothetical protein